MREVGVDASGFSVEADIGPKDSGSASLQREQPRRGALQRIWSQGKGKAGLVLLSVYLFLTVIGPALAPQDPMAQNLSATLQPPSAEHLFGTDQLGRDVLSRVLAAAPISLGIGLGGVILAFLVGVPIGVISGYFGGRFDFIAMRAVDILLSFPGIIFALGVVAVLGASTRNVVIAVGVVSIPVFARTARAVTESTRTEAYIEGSVALGASHLRVIVRHIMPNIAGTLLTLATLMFAATLLLASSLGFLGLGVQPPQPEWGTMLGEARGYLRTQSYLMTFPGIFLAGAALGLNLLGESLRVVYEPTARRRIGPVGWLQRRRSKRQVSAGYSESSHAAASNGASFAVQVEGLRVQYPTEGDPVEAVRGVSLRLRSGRMLAVVGESGSGKSTLLRAISTLMTSTGAVVAGGSIRVDGEELVGLPEKRARRIRRDKIGFVSQDPASALNPVFSIGDQLVEAIRHGTHLSKSVAKERAVDLLNAVGIGDAADRLRSYPHEFSGGMKQRVVIAMALAQDPIVLLADEPTSALDVTIQQQILALLRDLQRKREMAVMLVTHDLGLVTRFADDVAVMYGGTLVETGAVRDVFAHPRHPYTLALRDSVRSIHSTQMGALSVIEGEGVNLRLLPSGCVFEPRCPTGKGDALCIGSQPDLLDVGGSQASACHYAKRL